MIALLKMSDWDDARADGTAQDRRLERRMFVRKEVRAEAEARRLDHSLAALRRPALKLALHDLSYGGLCAISDTPIEAGERVSVFIPPNGVSGGWNAYGRVVRCAPSGMGYRVAVEFDPLPAA
jgi:hypothetical protein